MLKMKESLQIFILDIQKCMKQLSCDWLEFMHFQVLFSVMDLDDQHEASSDKDTDIESLPEVTNFKPVCGMTKGNQTVWNLSQVNQYFKRSQM